MQTDQELRPVVQDENVDFAPRRKYYGNLITLCPDENGEPKYMLGPHCTFSNIKMYFSLLLVLFVLLLFFLLFLAISQDFLSFGKLFPLLQD